MISYDVLKSQDSSENKVIIADGRCIAEARFNVCHDYHRLFENFRFTKSRTFSAYLESVSCDERYPIAFVNDLRVEKNLQNRGYGTKILIELESEVISRKCTLMMGRVGWSDDDDWENERAKNLYFFESRGWKLSYGCEFDPILIFKDLRESTPSSKAASEPTGSGR